jgi:tripartite-type tricarboxylate transporter receptor subunit TctC
VHTPAIAQTFPSKPIRFIAAFSRRRPSDIVARAVGRRMSETLGQPVVIDNQPVPAETSAPKPSQKHRPTVIRCYSAAALLRSRQPLHESRRSIPSKSFAPISLIVSNQYVLVTHPAVPARNVKELIRLAKPRREN